MYITKLSHFFNEDGEIPTDMPIEARELGNFLALLVDTTTDFESEPGFDSRVTCLNKGCKGIVRSTILFDENDEIYWECPVCKEAGTISEWEGSKWDNSKI